MEPTLLNLSRHSRQQNIGNALVMRYKKSRPAVAEARWPEVGFWEVAGIDTDKRACVYEYRVNSRVVGNSDVIHLRGQPDYY